MTLITDEAEFRRLVEDGQGVIYNENGGGPNNVLHKAGCWTLALWGFASSGKKYHDPQQGHAEEWLRANVGEQGQAWKRCEAHRCLGTE